MISTNEVVSKDANHHDNSSNIRPASTVNNSFRNQKMIKQFAQTLIFIVLIFVASFFRDVIKQEKIRKKERAEMASQIAHQNYLLEQERFLVKHREFLSTFLQYEHHCNKIHALLYKNPCGLTKVNDFKFNCKNCKGSSRSPKVRIQMGDRTPLDFALIYVFLASLLFLLVRAIIDVSKEFNAPSQDSDEKTSSLHDYATRRVSNASNSATPQKKRDSKVLQPRVSITTTSSDQQGSTSAEGNNECTTGIALNETSCVSSKFDRRSSVPATMGHNQYLLKDTIDFRRQSFEALNEEDENCSPETKKHRLIRR
ncbi:uncharacterized protein LOC134836471 [Culicoides brevitarsis]|uniref:uncharacterized protein LOC134836471 n=1 Tax=Culicoides brevitarsis TaxID=469753 RepID=UPI00307B48FB